MEVPMSTIGIIGAGVMGRAAAGKLIETGYSLIAFDTAVSALEKIMVLGAEGASSPAEVAGRADIILMFLPGPTEVEACVAGPHGLLQAARSGMVIVDMSTVDPGITVRMSEAARSQGMGYLDAPVLGRPASVGNWALPVGGSEEDLECVQPVLQKLASKIFLIGPSGTGNKVKLLNQLMFGAINAMTAEMMAIASQMGIEPGLLYETISASRAGTVSNLFLELGARIGEDRYEDPTFTVDLLVKDVRLAAQMARDHGAPPLLARTVEFMNEMAQVQGFGTEDTAVMWKSVKKMWEQKG
ncbi:MAG: NAD(P)-dependent oxidoreductase [Thermodesulfobacteriota bacterium]